LKRSTPGSIKPDNIDGDVSFVVGGQVHSMALTGNGTLYTWGGNDAGQLGYTTQGSFQSTPRRVESGARNYVMVSAGQKHSVALGIDGSVWCWGANNEGQLGNGLNNITVFVPTNPQLPPGSMASDIAAGFAHVLVVLGGQTIYAWGSNDRGQLGDGSSVSKRTPASITLPSGVQPDGITKVVAGNLHSLALLKSGRVLAWGWNGYGQLGDGTNIDRGTPVIVQKLNGRVIQLFSSSAGDYNLALLESGEVQAWGKGNSGQLGIGGKTSRAVPSTITGLAGTVTSAAVGRDHSLCAAGALWSWGWNEYGQVASGDTADVFLDVPRTVTALQGTVFVAAGFQHSFAISSTAT